jgi:MoxR-like ATPase
MSNMDQQSGQSLIEPDLLKSASETARSVVAELDAMLLGRHELHEMVLVGILARGHILLEGLPGGGKTIMINALGKLLGMEFRRVQFTPDLMPGDILGAHILQEQDGGERQMRFVPGPVFTNILLADEINRASPKTQSALLEAMQEGCVTLLGVTRELPRPFFVLASQNPIELEGTYPLPEAQVDRFLMKLSVAAADVKTMEEIITTRRHGTPPEPTTTFSREKLDELFNAVDAIYLPRAVARYAARLVAATHPDSPEAPANVKNYVTYGASPRAAIALAEAARALAMMRGQETVGFDVIGEVALAVLNHRILLNYKARFDGVSGSTIVDDLLRELDPVGMRLPTDVSVDVQDA